MMQRISTSHRGFTLVEMIIVIVITGIIGSMVAIFLRAPVQGYADSARRAEMTDIADTALRRIGRDVRAAVPNSLRLPAAAVADSSYFEFIPTRDGGRYRVTDIGAGGCGASGNDLDFTIADTCFEIVGAPISFALNDQIVIGSRQSDGNQPYQLVTAATSVRRAIPAAGAGNNRTFVTMTSTVKLPDSAELEGHRFEVVPADQLAVTYACINMQGGALNANGDGQGTLSRYQAYGFYAVQRAPAALGVAGAILANNVSDCHFAYDTGNAHSLLSVRLTITRGGESVNLYDEIHVNNIP